MTSNLTIPRQTLQQYECMRIQRIKQQRQRMQNMRDVIDKYSRIINQLQTHNKELIAQNQQLKISQKISWSNQKKDNEYYTMLQKYSKICIELEKQQKIRQNCQQTIQNLRKQLLSNDLNYNLPTYMGDFEKEEFKRKQIETDFEILLRLNDELKKQVYLLQKQNITLKEVIRDQSKTSYEKQSFWKQNMRTISKSKHTKQQKQNKPGIIKTTNKIYSKNPSQFSSQAKMDPNVSIHPQHNLQIKRSRRDLQYQVKKQAQLIQKFKQTQEKQIKLIELLKSQKQPVCVCHSQGHTSSKKLISNAKISGQLVTFKKDLGQGQKR